ncbi:dimethyladenosine transferase [Dehalogenimonas sp. WBC-2]|nr:dimethyladenosine transferase [Dehalogenimonas sp. WBC-2]
MAETRALLERFGVSARKGLGQNFLIDRGVLDKIMAAANIGSDDTVVEVGPGLGILTKALAERAGKVIAVEIDRDLVALLRQTLAETPAVEIVSGDIMEESPSSLAGDAPYYKVVANLPYYITSAVLRHFLEAQRQPRTLTVMVQKEVARQITAKPPEMSLLSISVQLFGKPKVVSYIPAGAFHPPPKVASAILQIEVLPERRLSSEDEKQFFKLARAGFGTRRKQLANALSGGLDLEKMIIIELLQKSGIDPARRAETLTIEDWLRLLASWKEGYV